MEGLRYLEVEIVGHIALNLGLHILYSFLLILPNVHCTILWIGEILMPCPSIGPKLFWTGQIILVEYELFWTGPIRMVGSKS